MAWVYRSNRKTTADRVHIMEDHFHKRARVYPTLADWVTVTWAAWSWTLWAFVEIVPVNTITNPFDIHWINIEDASADDEYELVLYAATTEIWRVRFRADTWFLWGALPAIHFQCPQQAANTQIQAKVASMWWWSDTVDISIHYHTY